MTRSFLLYDILWQGAPVDLRTHFLPTLVLCQTGIWILEPTEYLWSFPGSGWDTACVKVSEWCWPPTGRVGPLAWTPTGSWAATIIGPAAKGGTLEQSRKLWRLLLRQPLTSNGVPIGKVERRRGGGELASNQNAFLLLPRPPHGRGSLLAAGGGINAAMQAASCCRPAALQLPQLTAAVSWAKILWDRDPRALKDSHQGPGVPWPLAVSTTADVSPGSGRGQGKASKAGRQPALRPAGQRPLSPANSRRTSSVLVQPPRQSVSRRDGRPPHGLCPPAGAGPPAALPALRRLPAHRGRRALQRGAQEVDPAEAAAR